MGRNPRVPPEGLSSNPSWGCRVGRLPTRSGLWMGTWASRTEIRVRGSATLSFGANIPGMSDARGYHTMHTLLQGKRVAATTESRVRLTCITDRDRDGEEQASASVHAFKAED